MADLAQVAVGNLNGWECQRITRTGSVLYLIERADQKLHEAPTALRPKIDAALDGVSTSPPQSSGEAK